MVYNKKATDKLFDSIDSISVNPQQALEDFKKAVLEGADVNAFDDDNHGNPLLTCVIQSIGIARATNQYHVENRVLKADVDNALLESDYKILSALKEMLELLVGHEDININATSTEKVFTKKRKTDENGNLVFYYSNIEESDPQKREKMSQNRSEVIQLVNEDDYTVRYVYYDTGKDVVESGITFSEKYDAVYEKEEQKLDSEGKPILVGNTPLHVAFMLGDEDAISALCRHQDIRSDIENHEGVKPEDIILKQITELKEKIRDDKNMHLTEKLALEKTIKDFEEQELRIKSKMEEIARNKGNPATVQNQEDKVVVGDMPNTSMAQQERILNEIEEQQKKEDESIQKLMKLKSENYNFHSDKGQELTAIIRDKSASAKIINVLFDQEILTTKITLTLLKQSIALDTNLLDLNNHFVKTAVERVTKSEAQGREGVAEAIIKAVHSTLTIIQNNKSANLHIKDLNDKISYLEEIVKSLEPLKQSESYATTKLGIDAFYDRKNAILRNKTRDGTQALDVQHTQPLVGASNKPFVEEARTSARSLLSSQPNGAGGFYSPQTSVSSEGSGDEDKSPAGSSDPDYGGQYQSLPPTIDENKHQGVPKTPTFWDKLSANKGKFTAGTIGASLLIAGIITALVVANPIVVACAIVAAVLGAIMLGGVALAKTTDKGEKMWDQAGQKLSSLLVSNREQRWL